ncbi:MAG: DUF4402 domain-containing protein [Pontixanthobacter sp.]
MSVLLPCALMAGSQAAAEPGVSISAPGSGEAVIVEPIGLQNVVDLRFGRIIRPTANGTVRIANNGNVTETGGATGLAITTPQRRNGRGPAALAAFGDPFRLFLTGIANQSLVSNGTVQMRVDQYTVNTGFLGLRQFDADGYAPLLIGGRLNINANQQTGTYTGTFPVTILYL